MSAGTRVAKAATLMMVAMMLSRLLGFAREAILGGEFGQSGLTDSYLAAFTIPDILYFLLVGGVLSTAFIPVFSGFVAKGEIEDSNRVGSTFINIIIILMVVGILIGEWFTPYFLPLLVSGLSEESMARVAYLTRIMLPSVMFTGLAGLSMGILNSYKHFASPALGSILYNVAIIALGWFMADTWGIVAFSVGVVVGAILNFAVQIPSLIKTGFRYRFALDLKHPGVKQISILIVPALVGLAVNQIQDVVFLQFSSHLEEGNISALRFANRLMQLPLGVFAMAISMAIFPTLTELAAKNQMKDFVQSMSLGIRSIIFITMPSAVGLAVLAVPLIQVLFERKQFTHQATLNTASILVFFALGLVALGANQILPRVFYALQKPKVVVRITAISLGVFIVLAFLLMPLLGARGLALAFSLSAFANLGMFFWILRRGLGDIDEKRLGRTIRRSFLASVFMGVVLFGLNQLLSSILPEGFLGLLLHVGVAVAVGAGIYGGAAYVLRMEEMAWIGQMIARRLGRSNS